MTDSTRSGAVPNKPAPDYPKGATPGPWKAVPFSSVVGCPITAQPDPKKNTVILAGVHGAFGDDYRSEVEANARLIAAAPELFEALAAVCEILEVGGNFAAWRGARDAGLTVLAKARGEVAK